MAKHTPPQNPDNWKKFAVNLFDQFEADPGYYAIQRSELNKDRLLRFAIAWTAYYNLGVAADACQHQGEKFWQYLNAVYTTAKRASERRHFRGKAGLLALAQWQEKWKTPERMAEHMYGETYFEVRKKGQKVPQYGDYFYWKWCDLNEVLFDNTPDMAGSARYSPKVPQQGAMLIADMQNGWDGMDTEKVYEGIVRYCEPRIACPTADRAFGIQEAETVCCVYKQYISGGYVYGSRAAKAVARLSASKTATAQEMKQVLLDLSPYTEKEMKDILLSLQASSAGARPEVSI